MSLRARICAPTDATRIVWFRIVFGLLLAFECVRYLAAGWVRDYWITPDFHFTYYGFGWVQPWPGDGMLAHFVALAVLALCVATGAAYRLTAPLFTVGFAYVFLLDQSVYLNHFYAVILFAALLAIMPANAAASVDARRSSAATLPVWTLWSLRAQIGVIYAFGGLAKLNADWLHGQPLTMWLQGSEHLPDFLRGTAGLYLSWAGAAFDLAIVPALLWSKTCRAAFWVAVAFHLTNAWLFHIGIFPWMSIAATALFLPRDHWLFRPVRHFETPSDSPTPPTYTWQLVVLAGWLATQLLMPLRPYVYDTHVHWTEDGHRFSWHMKLRTKYATGVFWIEHPDGTRERVDMSRFLTEQQRSKMLARPDMILQFAHHVARSHADVKVYGLVHASLNGRPPAPLTDVEVDLAAEPRTLSSPTWVLPFRNTPIQPASPHEIEE